MCHQPVKARSQGQKCNWRSSHMSCRCFGSILLIYFHLPGELELLVDSFPRLSSILKKELNAKDDACRLMLWMRVDRCVSACVCIQRIWSCQTEFYLLLTLTQHRTRATINVSDGHLPSLCSVNISYNCKMSCKKWFVIDEIHYI